MGMTLRDYFAAMALQGLISAGDSILALLGAAARERNMDNDDITAIAAYEYADAMLKARER